MWLVIYNILFILVSPIILLVLVSKKRCRRGLGQRIGFLSDRAPFHARAPGDQAHHVIWVHAVSMGEVVAAVPLIQELHSRYPDHEVVVSTATETGREAVEQRLGGIATHFYAPLDFPWVVDRVVDRLRPKAYLFVETELWPNLLRTLARRNIPSVMVNGRLSTPSFRRYRRTHSFWSWVLRNVTWFLMQSDRDADRILGLGVSPSRVMTTGNVKFDQPVPVTQPGDSSFSREAIGIGADEDLIVAGSTHPVEEDQLLDCYKRLHQKFPSLVLLLAPRHIERADELEGVVRSAGLEAVRRSRLGAGQPAPHPSGRPRVIILDTRGELMTAYSQSVMAFVGGTLVPIGGHNLLEPALWGKPVLFGPHTDHCVEIAAMLIQAGGGIQVAGVADLAREMEQLLEDCARLDVMGQAARRVIDENRGALDKTLVVIDKVLRDHAKGEMDRPSDLDWGHSSADNHHAAVFRPLSRAVTVPYELLVQTRLFLYERGWLRTHKLPRPVISVGNLTVGGTGKTPLVIEMARWLKAKGKRVCILSRGYRRRSQAAMVLVSDGERTLVSPAEAGDEPYLMAQQCPGVVVAVGANRYQVGQWILKQFPIDCFLLDDGFQHVALHRDVNLLVVDASDMKGLEGLYPVGRLREPLGSASRATAIVVTRVQEDRGWRASLAPIMSRVRPRCGPIVVRFMAERVVEVGTGRPLDISSLKGRPAAIFSGIGNPDSFRRLAVGMGVRIVAERQFRDHHHYTGRDVEDLLRLADTSGAEVLLTTAKDAAKVVSLFPKESALLAVHLGTEFLEGRDCLEELVFGLWDRAHATACA